jgi:hypothetical protein
MLRVKAESQKVWPFRYAERFSGTSPPLADLLFLAMKKSITERTRRVMHDNASSEGTRKGWEGRLERQSQIIEEI